MTDRTEPRFPWGDDGRDGEGQEGMTMEAQP
jgi:hypothetical protein